MTDSTLIKPLFLDDPKAPEIFASLLVGAASDGSNARLTFASARVNHETNPGPVTNVVNLRIVMTIPAARDMVALLSQFLAGAAFNATGKPDGQSLQ